jgi:hypothetical protein
MNCLALRSAAVRMITVTTVATALASCANMTSIYRTFDVSSAKEQTSEGVFVDAQQRAIVSSPVRTDSNGKAGDPPIICAEPSPDAIASVSASMAASAVMPRAMSGENEARGSAAIASAVDALKRGSTVQLLRDGLYRACEGYMNGSLSRAEYVSLFHKFADAAVTMLAVESMTPKGVISPEDNASGVQARSSSGSGGAAPASGSGGPTAAAFEDDREMLWKYAATTPAARPEEPQPGAGGPSAGAAQAKVVDSYFRNNIEREKDTRISTCMSYLEKSDYKGNSDTEYRMYMERRGLQMLFCAQNFDSLSATLADPSMKLKLLALFDVYIQNIKNLSTAPAPAPTPVRRP